MDVREYIQASWESKDPARFPGPQPVSIERRHFPLLKKQPYFICEKTDGVRHFLVSIDSGVYVVNRAFKTDQVKIRIPKDTLLDGELVETKAGKTLFVVHDAVRVKGENLLKLPLDQRLEKARSVTKGIIKTSTAPFEVRVKTMWPLGTQIPDLNSFEYETDGIVLTPINEPIRMGTHETMFKWKPRNRITIDFQIFRGCELWVQDRGEPYKEAELHIQNRRPDLADGTIVECGYGTLGWFVEKIRTDKTHANNRRTYFRTCVNLRENIQLEEITGGTTPGKIPL
jgi:hypothetical protein